MDGRLLRGNNGNVTASTRSEHCSDSTVAAVESSQAPMAYDCINQMTTSAQPGADGSIDLIPGASNARINYMGYDSRGNGRVSVDGKGNRASK